MLTTPTVFVLGAGANVPYGLPSGKDLTAGIIGMLPEKPSSRKQDFVAAFYTVYGTGAPIEKACADFRHKLNHSLQTSVDAFLRFYSGRKGFEQIGKLAVARVLLPLEFKMAWRRGTPHDDWLTYLFERLHKGCHESIDVFIEKNYDVSFVTFNYDRTLEHFMTIKLANTYGISREAAWDKIKEWDNIIHVYGSLGDFSVEELDRHLDLTDARAFERPAKSIQLMYDDRGQQETIHRAKRVIGKAQSALFLGFAFDSDNVERLNLNKYCESKSVLGATRFRLTDEEWFRITREMHPSQFTASGEENSDCLSFLRNCRVL